MSNSRDDAQQWDVRTIERRIREGLVSRKDLEKHLSSLPDVANKAAEPDDDED
jgi:hypothetical protein